MKPTFSILINSMAGGGAERQIWHLWKRFQPKVYLLESDMAYDMPGADISVLGSGRIKKFLLPWYALQFRTEGVVLSFLEFSNFINLLGVLIFKRRRAIVSVRISPDHYGHHPLGLIYLGLMKLLFPLAWKVVCNSVDCAKQIHALTGVTPIVIPNGLDFEALGSPIESASLNQKTKTIVVMGRLVAQKNILAFIKLFAELHRRQSDIRLIILGEGPLRGEIESLIEGLALKEVIQCMGFTKNPVVVLRQAQLFVLPSLSEGFPNALIEAMAIGLPVVAADCPTGPAEILEDNVYGKLLPQLTSASMPVWLNALDELLGSAETMQHFHQRSLLRAKDFELSGILGQWEKVLGEACAE